MLPQEHLSFTNGKGVCEDNYDLFEDYWTFLGRSQGPWNQRKNPKLSRRPVHFLVMSLDLCYNIW